MSQSKSINGNAYPADAKARLQSLRDALDTLASLALDPVVECAMIAGAMPPPADLEQAMTVLRPNIPAVMPQELASITAMPRVGKGMEAWVYLDEASESVYKIVDVDQDGRVDGVKAGGIIGLNEGGDKPQFYSYPIANEDPTVAEYLRDQIDPVLYGPVVYTEPAGITTDGRYLLFKQPYVWGVRNGTDALRESMARPLGLVNAGESGKVRLGRMPDGRTILFVDMHTENLVYSTPMLEAEASPIEGTPACLLDASARILSDEEAKIVEPLLADLPPMPTPGDLPTPERPPWSILEDLEKALARRGVGPEGMYFDDPLDAVYGEADERTYPTDNEIARDWDKRLRPRKLINDYGS